MALTLHAGTRTPARTLAVWCVIGLGFALPITPAGANLLIALTLLFWLSSGEWREKSRALKASPVALAFLAFCGLVLVGACYGQGSGADKLHYLVKYLSLLLVPLLISLHLSPGEKLKALAAFCAAMLLTLIISILIWLGYFSGSGAIFSGATRANPVVFKLSITHGFFMAFAAFFFSLAAANNRHSRAFWPLLTAALLASCNVLFMVPGRTGYLTLGVLLLYLFYQRYGGRGLALSALLTALLAVAAYQMSPTFHGRVAEAAAQAAHWQAGKGDPTSIGLRFDYYTNTLHIIEKSPLIGVGIGGFPAAYDEEIRNTGMAPSNNPHNQYLLTTAQMGAIGLFALLALYGIYWRAARRLQPPYAQLAMAVLLGFLIGNLFNSFMMDFAERIFFAWATGLFFSTQSPGVKKQDG